MTIQEFAKMLDGREYGDEMITAHKLKADDLGFVVVYGYSDDNAEFRGAIDEEVGCWNGKTIYLDGNGIFKECDCECAHSVLAKQGCRTIEAVWHDEGEYCWTYETDIPHAVFNIMEDSTGYCKGIVFDMKSLQVTP